MSAPPTLTVVLSDSLSGLPAIPGISYLRWPNFVEEVLVLDDATCAWTGAPLAGAVLTGADRAALDADLRLSALVSALRLDVREIEDGAAQENLIAEIAGLCAERAGDLVVQAAEVRAAMAEVRAHHMQLQADLCRTGVVDLRRPRPRSQAGPCLAADRADLHSRSRCVPASTAAGVRARSDFHRPASGRKCDQRYHASPGPRTSLRRGDRRGQPRGHGAARLGSAHTAHAGRRAAAGRGGGDPGRARAAAPVAGAGVALRRSMRCRAGRRVECTVGAEGLPDHQPDEPAAAAGPGRARCLRTACNA